MKKGLTVFPVVLGLAGFFFGLFELFQLRFEVGDVYPAYSSLRADPLGTMALCESLEKIPAVTVRRDFSAGNKLPEDGRSTYFHLGAMTHECIWMPLDLIKEIEGFATGGGRLVITLLPEKARPSYYRTTTDESDPDEESSGGESYVKKHPKKKSTRAPEPLSRRTLLKDRWGLEVTYLTKAAIGSASQAEIVGSSQSAASKLPAELAWHSATVFTNLDPAWRVLYTRDSNPVLIERRFGSGSVVIATDSWFISNEAMLKDREPALLSWLVGPSREVVFDEAHFGLVETAGVATLMRKYRLGGFIVAALLVAALFVWKNSFSLVPPLVDAEAAAAVAGKEASAGFVNLLRRNIAPRDALTVCFAEWKKSHPEASAAQTSRATRAQAVLDMENAKPKNQRNPIAAYQEITRILKRT